MAAAVGRLLTLVLADGDRHFAAATILATPGARPEVADQFAAHIL